MGEQRYFQKGFGFKAAIQPELVRDYHSRLVADLKAAGRQLRAGPLTVKLAAEFGFCYGVDRAIEYAYETRRKFPDRRLFLVGEIIHNPGVNARLEEMGIRFLTGDFEPPDEGEGEAAVGADGAAARIGFDAVTAEDVVILPAFGVTVEQMAWLRARGAVLVDTTCGSVLNVWKRVERYAREGLTSLIHGKHYHEETRATASRAMAHPGSHYLVVRDFSESALVEDYIRGRGHRGRFMETFRVACSPGFDPDRHLARIGVANQTTMLSSESLAIAVRIKAAMAAAHGQEYVAANFLSFDTICSATQDRQDAVQVLLDEGVDVVVVIGGYNSSNTANLARICSERVPTYHVARSECLADDGSVRFLPAGARTEVHATAWLPEGAVRVGVTAGASTPDSEVGAVISRILALRGLTAEAVAPAMSVPATSDTATPAPAADPAAARG